MREQDTSKLLDKIKEKEERFKKIKMEKQEYNKFMAELHKDLTIKKHGLDAEVLNVKRF